jgi:hypothetical protein
MAKIIFTDRELKRGWRDLYKASEQLPRNNAHRLLLLYSIECGLKAVWLRNKQRTVFDDDDIAVTGHNLREIIKQLGFGAEISLPDFELKPVRKIKDKPEPRRGGISDLHQAWRYGGMLINTPDDVAMEEKLEVIQKLIKKELH